MTTQETIEAFIAAINAHDAAAIVALCTPDHRFIDAHGAELKPAELEAGWRGYFAFMPGYGIKAETMLCDGGTAAVFGAAWGSLDHEGARAWRRPCAWRAELREGKVALWQVYIDTKVVFDLLAKKTSF